MGTHNATDKLRQRLYDAATDHARSRAVGHWAIEGQEEARVGAYADALEILGSGGVVENWQRRAYMEAHHAELRLSSVLLAQGDMAEAKRARLAAEAALELADLARREAPR